jgi:hypothetical protein
MGMQRTATRLTAGLMVGLTTVGLVSLASAPAMADSISDAYVEYWCDASDDSTVFDVTLIADGVPGVSNSLNFVVDVDGQTVEDVIVDPGEQMTIEAVDWRYADDPEVVLDVWVYYPPEESFDGQEYWDHVGSWSLGFEQECAASGDPTAPTQTAPAPAPSAPAAGSTPPSTPPSSAGSSSGGSSSGGSSGKPSSGGGTSGKPSSSSGTDSQDQASENGSGPTTATETEAVADVEPDNSRRGLIAVVAALGAVIVFGIGILAAKTLSRD